MIHLVISTPRSGSNALCRYLQSKTGSTNLYEVITDYMDSHSRVNKDIVSIVDNLLEKSMKEDIVAKCHVEQLLLLYPQHADVLDKFLKSAKLYYCLRANLTDQIKSFRGIEITGICDQRANKQNILITGEDALRIRTKILLETEIQGEIFKQYPGEVAVLENMSSEYSAKGSGKYSDTYSYSYDSFYTQQYVEQTVDLLEVFNRGNSLYSITGIGAVW